MPLSPTPHQTPARAAAPAGRRRGARILACLAGAAAALTATGLTATSAGDLQGRIDASRAAVASLRSQVAGESANISATAGGLAAASTRLSTLQAQLSTREAQLAQTQHQLLAARDHLLALENRLQIAAQALAANLRASYEGSRPDIVSVILSARGFTDLLEQIAFMQRVGHEDASVVAVTRSARAAVRTQANALAALEARDRTLTTQVLGQRNEVAALHDALLRRQIAQLGTRSRVATKLNDVRGQLGALEAKAAAQARAAAAAAAAAATATASASPQVGAIAVNTGGMAQPSAGAPTAVAQVMAAGNAIATLPYVWGGGHGSFHDSGYDCSGSVSYALAAAGLLSSPLDSTGFESWGDPGPGRWITVYANAGHAFMVVDGWRFDTVALAEGGTRWTQTMTDTSAFVARHPPGL